jgi:hypothetical protein
MNAKLPMLLVFVTAVGCGAQAPARQASAPARLFAEPGRPAAEPAPAPAETLAGADRAYDSQLGASRGQFDVDRQVAVLKEAVLLYGQFLERAEGRPELEPAVRKSRERIADANATIIFLEASRKGAPPAASPE